jgi:hypothetical protein
VTAFFRRIDGGPLGFILCLKCETWSAVGDVSNLPYQFASHVEADHARCIPLTPELR